jgi:PhnB protein
MDDELPTRRAAARLTLRGKYATEQEVPMADVDPVPRGTAAVSPWVIGPDTAALLEFVTLAFGAKETSRMKADDGRIVHAEFTIGGTTVLAFDGKPEWPPTPAFLRVYVPDTDAAYRRALAAGATTVTEPTPVFWGDRVARVRDPVGNLWWIHSRVEEVGNIEMMRRMSDPEWKERLAYVERTLTVPEYPRD